VHGPDKPNYLVVRMWYGPPKPDPKIPEIKLPQAANQRVL
jgi:hypothetical protein